MAETPALAAVNDRGADGRHLVALQVLLTFALERALLRERLKAELENAVAIAQISAAELDRFLKDVDSTTLAIAQALMATVRVDTQGNVPVVHVEGEIDIVNASQIGGRLFDAAPNDAPGVVVDLSGVTYLDSRGLHLLFELAERACASGINISTSWSHRAR